MSFDLYFCWRKRERVIFDEVEAWAKGIKYFTQKNAQFWYSNPKTGVYFSFDFESEAPKSPEDGPDIPDGYYDSGLSFNLNYNRPSYFGFEAMPIVETLARRFGFSVVNPQGGPDGSEAAITADCESLIHSWVHHNHRAIRTLMEHASLSRPLRMPAAASLYLWRYAQAKEELERTCGDGIYVPSLVPVHNKGETKAGRVIAYTEGLPRIVPECEWVFRVRRKKELFRAKQEHEVSTVSAETFLETLANQIRPFHWENLRVQVISSEFAEQAGKIMHKVEATLPRSDFEVVGMDSFVDIDLP